MNAVKTQNRIIRKDSILTACDLRIDSLENQVNRKSILFWELSPSLAPELKKNKKKNRKASPVLEHSTSRDLSSKNFLGLSARAKMKALL